MLILFTDDGPRLLPIVMRLQHSYVVADHNDLYKVTERAGFIVSFKLGGSLPYTLLTKTA